jgi:anti-sigma-K factor RskA
MTDKRDQNGDPRQLAAELALGVLEGDELSRARAMVASDAEFRNEVERWSGRLAPLLDEVEPAPPPGAVWRGIEARLGPTSANDNMATLQRRVGMWRGIAGAAMAIAASLAVVLVVQPQPQTAAPTPPAVAASPPMVAMLGDEKRMMLVASWDPMSRQLVLAVAGDMPADPRHSHELWVIPADGKPRSLGVMGDSKQAHMKLAEALADLMSEGATVALSVEPRGGSPTGSPTGPVVASGALHSA